MAVHKQIVGLVARALDSTLRTNNGWKAAINAAVKRAYSAPDEEKETLQYVVDCAPFGVRPAVASALRRCGITIDKQEGHARCYVVQGIADRKKQAATFEYLGKNGEGLADLVAMADKLPKEKKSKVLEGTPAARAEKAITKFLTRLSESDPAAKAVANDRLTAAKSKTSNRDSLFKEARADVMKKHSGSIVDEDGSQFWTLSHEEYHAAMAAVMKLRLEVLNPTAPAAAPASVEKLAKEFRRAA